MTDDSYEGDPLVNAPWRHGALEPDQWSEMDKAIRRSMLHFVPGRTDDQRVGLSIAIRAAASEAIERHDTALRIIHRIKEADEPAHRSLGYAAEVTAYRTIISRLYYTLWEYGLIRPVVSEVVTTDGAPEILQMLIDNGFADERAVRNHGVSAQWMAQEINRQQPDGVPSDQQERLIDLITLLWNEDESLEPHQVVRLGLALLKWLSPHPTW